MHTHPTLAAARIGTGCTRVLVTFYEPGEQVQQNSNNTRGDPGGRTTIAHTPGGLTCRFGLKGGNTNV